MATTSWSYPHDEMNTIYKIDKNADLDYDFIERLGFNPDECSWMYAEDIAIFKYIEGWYNRKRLHSSINYMTSDQCELLARSAA